MMVFTIRNLIRAALALTTVLGGVALMYALLGADFLAVAQLVGLRRRDHGADHLRHLHDAGPDRRARPGRHAASASARCWSPLAVGIISVWVVIFTPWKVRDSLLDMPTAESIGGLLLTRYVLPFEIASLLLTVALIGAIVIATQKTGVRWTS